MSKIKQIVNDAREQAYMQLMDAYDYEVDYHYGLLPPNYPVPALLQDSCSNLGQRWASYMDDGIRLWYKY